MATTIQHKRKHGFNRVAAFALAALLALGLGSGISAATPESAQAAGSKSYKIVYKLNGGTQAKGQVKKVAKGKTVKVSSLKKPTRTGYTFKGWYSDAKLTKKAKSVKGVAKKSKRTLYAKWSPKKYKITYKLNKGKLTGSYAKTYKYGKGAALPTPERKGYEFVGWYSDKALTKAVAKITTKNRGNKTLYAKWKVVKYGITYNLNGGSLSGNYATTYKVTKAVSLPTPTRAGYAFLGWYTNKALTKPIDSIAKGSTGAKKLYAKWIERVVVAHRGLYRNAAQNSVAAFIAAAEAGFKYVEGDVRFTKDGVPVMLHDATVPVWVEVPVEPDDPDDPDGPAEDGEGAIADAAVAADVPQEAIDAAMLVEEERLSDEGGALIADIASDEADAPFADEPSPEGEGLDGDAIEVQADGAEDAGEGKSATEKVLVSIPVDEMTYDELQSTELGRAKSGPDGANVSTFEQFMATCADWGLVPYVDVKAGTKSQVAGLLATARSYGMPAGTRWLSGNIDVLKRVMAADSSAKLAYYNGTLSAAKVKNVVALGSGDVVVMTNASNVTSAVVNRCKAARLPLGLYNVKDETAIPSLDPYVYDYTIDGLSGEVVPEFA